MSARHEALVYDDDVSVASQINGLVDAALLAGGDALVCVPPRIVEHLRSGLRAEEGRVEVREVAQRYARPVDAMGQLWRFAKEHLAGGASHVVSIGELPLFDDHAVDAWLWYEAAVTHVLDPLPVHAVCLLDRRALSSRHLQQMADAHQPDHDIRPMPVLPLPDTAPTATLSAATPRRARELVADIAAPLGAEVVDAALLVVSELVTNAVQHSGTGAHLEMWTTADEMIVAVRDDGPGIGDPAACLRPPDLPHRGAGLWLCNQLADRFSVHDRSPHGCEARASFRRAG